MELIRLIKTEFLKMKRTKTLWIAIICPFFVAFMIVMSGLSRSVEGNQVDIMEMAFSNATAMWLMVMLILFISAEIGALMEYEHIASAFKYTVALPVKRSNIYLAKLLTGIILTFISNVLLAVFVYLAGKLVFILNPKLGFIKEPDLLYFIKMLSLSFAAAFLIISIHTWMSSKFKSYVVPIGMGILAVVGNLMALGSEKFALVFPWIQPFNVMQLVGTIPGETEAKIGTTLLTVLLFSIIGGILVNIFALIEFNKRDIK